ncbi:MAG: hypothetical protein ACYDAO_09365 [Thermoplasmataceae archaeon]
MALLSKNPILEVTKDESEKLAVAVKGVLAEYDLRPSSKMLAWTNLAAISVAVYSPRIVVLIAQSKLAKEAKKTSIPPNPTQTATDTQAPNFGTIRYN